MGNNLVLAPIKGYTDPLWRSCYFSHFTGIDKVVTPFLLLSEHNSPKKSYFPQFLPEIGSDIEVVPQFLVKTPQAIVSSVKMMNELGIKEYNLNMGCPAPAIYKKGRGSGLLENLDSVRMLLDGVIGQIVGKFTVKIRTGIEDSSLIGPLIDLFNNYKIDEIIVHPRFAKQLYNGIPDMDAFDYVYNNSINPVSYNGNIYSLNDYNRLKDKYPRVSSWMIGRGVLRDPFLPNSIKTGIEPTLTERNAKLIEYIMDFNNIVHECYKKEGIAISRVKSIMIYIASFYSNDSQVITSVKHANNLNQMLDIISLN